MSLAGFLISFTTKQSAKRFEKATQDPVGVQNQKLLGMVQKNADIISLKQVVLNYRPVIRIRTRIVRAAS